MVLLLGKAIYYLGAGILLILYIGVWMEWLGFIGFFLGTMFSPGIVVFPFIFWLIEGSVPYDYFLIYASAIIGYGIMQIGYRLEREY